MKGLGLLGLLLFVSAGLAVPAGAPPASDASFSADYGAPEPSLFVVFNGPSNGTDAADPYERLAGAATGEYFTQATANGYGRLSGRIWLYPSVCVDCVLVTPYSTTEESGLLAVQYSFAARGAEQLSLRLSGSVDWEIVFEHEVAGIAFGTNDPYGSPVAEKFYQFKHEARASVENDFEYERTLNVYAPVDIAYEAVPLTAADPPSLLEPAIVTEVVEKTAAGGWVRLTYLSPN